MKQKNIDLLVNELSAISTHLTQTDKVNIAMVKMLSDRLTRIEVAQADMLKRFIDVIDKLGDIEDVQDEQTKRQDGDDLDRGQTASALHGLIKRLDKLEVRLSKTKEPA